MKQRSKYPTIVFCTTCKGRLSHLKETLPRNIQSNADYPNAKFVVLGYGDAELAQFMRDFKHDRLVFYHHETTERFHMAHAKNMAARCGIYEGADILVTVDADNFTGDGFAKLIHENLDKLDRNGFLCPDFHNVHQLRGTPDFPGRGFAGRLAIRAQDFIKFGGYDEVFDTWRGEDIDLIARMQRGGYKQSAIDPRYLRTIPHSAEIRFKEYPHAQELYENKQQLSVIGARTETVVNFGKLGVGTVRRNDEYSLTFNPIPTRVFGIGMHKTATSSLHEAFQLLGLDSFHWGEGESPVIWQEMTTAGRSNMLERWYSLCDLPIPLLYQQLDKAYPGSKFILTIRSEQAWLRSVEKLWDYKHNPTRWVWDKYPFTNRIHKVLYGREDFEPRVFLDRYKRHNEEVMAYFKDRPGDLLIMDVEAGARWGALPGFLGMPVPDVPYPIRNVSEPRKPEAVGRALLDSCSLPCCAGTEVVAEREVVVVESADRWNHLHKIVIEREVDVVEVIQELSKEGRCGY